MRGRTTHACPRRTQVALRGKKSTKTVKQREAELQARRTISYLL